MCLPILHPCNPAGMHRRTPPCHGTVVEGGAWQWQTSIQLLGAWLHGRLVYIHPHATAQWSKAVTLSKQDGYSNQNPVCPRTHAATHARPRSHPACRPVIVVWAACNSGVGCP